MISDGRSGMKTLPLQMRLLVWFALSVILTVTQSGCRSYSPEEQVLRKAYEALRAGDWSGFQAQYKNRYVLLSRQTSPNIFAAQQTFAGSVLAPEEEARIQKLFARAASSTSSGAVNFKSEHFKAIERIGDISDEILSEFGSNPNFQLRMYAITTKEASPGARPRPPYFLLTVGPIPKIIDVQMPEE